MDYEVGYIQPGFHRSENVRKFLKWWQSKLYRKCIVDLENGYFVDQKFIDFVPVYFKNVFIEKNVGYNVAYWNLHSRRLTRDKGTWLCNGEPLYFFHFSGYPAPERGAVSMYLPNGRSRFEFSTRPDVQRIFSHYKNLLLRNEYKRTRTLPYTFGYFKTGEPIPYQLREHYRNHSTKWRRWDDPFGSPELKRRAGITPMPRITPMPGMSESLQMSPTIAGMEHQNGFHEEASNGHLHKASIELPTEEETARAELDAILTTRAWRWASRYGRIKYRYLMPTYRFFGKSFGSTNGHRETEED